MSTWRPLPERRGSAPPHRVADSLDQVARRVGVPKASSLAVVFARWSEIVGDAVAAHSRPHSLRDGVLLVTVDEPGWATQLGFLGPTIVERCNEVAGPASVASIEVRVDRPRGPSTTPRATPRGRRETR